MQKLKKRAGGSPVSLRDKWMMAPIFVFTLGLLTGCAGLPKPINDIADPYEKNFELVGKEKERVLGTVNPAIFRTVDRDFKEGTPTEIPVVPKEGVEIQLDTGRYVITGYPVGNIFVYDENGELIITEIVGDYTGPRGLTLDIDASYTVRADGGYDSVAIYPVPTNPSIDLTTGLWKVGLDINPGEYDIEIGSGYGYLHILEEDKEPVVYELIGGKVGKTDGRVTLVPGQMLRVTDISMINFIPRTN